MNGPCRVIDAIRCEGGWIHRYPRAAERGEGLLVVLHPEDISTAPEIGGHLVVVRRPDGSALRLVVDGAECPHGAVGLFFKGASPEDVPVGSAVEW